MNNLFLIVLLCTFISCKKEALKSELILEKETVKPRVQLEGKPTNIDSAVVISSHNKVLKDFYSSTNYRTVWQSEKKRKIVLAELLKSSEEGLNPEDYNLKTLYNFEKRATTLDSLDIVKYDILLTSCLQKYISHLTNGRLNPRKLYKNWDLKENYIDLNATVALLLQTDSLAYKIQQLKPSHIVYKRLKKALRQINTFPKDDFKPIKFTKIITPNDTNPSLIAIKKRLIYWKEL